MEGIGKNCFLWINTGERYRIWWGWRMSQNFFREHWTGAYIKIEPEDYLIYNE